MSARWTTADLASVGEKIKSDKELPSVAKKASPRGCKVANTGISRLICTSVREQTAAYLLDWLERTGQLPPDATFEHSGDLTSKITWKKFEWSFLIQ